jgi:hypothetical protein
MATQPHHCEPCSLQLDAMAKLADLSDSEDEEVVFMTAEERQKSKINEKESIDPGAKNYTAKNVASIRVAARLLEEHNISCFVAHLH